MRMKKLISISLIVFLLSCNSSELSNKNISDSTGATLSGDNKLAEASPAAVEGIKTDNTAVLTFDSTSSDAKANQIWIWCCHSIGHPGRPDVDRCATEWKFSSYPDCNSWTIVHKNAYPSHDCGCRPM